MGYNQYAVPDTVAVEPTFVAFLQHSQTQLCQWSLVLFFQISLKNSELKTTHNTFRDCHVHFFPQPFSKQLYIVGKPHMKGLLRQAGLSLKGGSWGFHPATLNMAPGYTFKGKYNVEERHGSTWKIKIIFIISKWWRQVL